MAVMIENKVVPQLRFGEFENDWNNHLLDDIATFLKGKGISKSELDDDGKTECIRYGELYVYYNELIDEIKSKTNLENLVLSKANDVIIPASGETQLDIATASCVLRSGIALGGDLNVIRTENNGLFLSYYLNSKKKFEIARLSQGSSVVHLYASQLKTLKLNLPSLPEQQKIASFLSAVDEKLQKLNKKKDLLEEYKKGVMQKIFSQELRFKDANGNSYPNWEEKKFGEVFERITQKNKENNQNVLTISAQQGLINQLEYFTKSVSAKDVSGYYLLEKGDFAYNKSYSKGYPLGAIKKLNRYDKGVVSTLYICFRVKELVSSVFFEKFFDYGGINKEINKIAQEGARNHGLLNISVIEFFRDIIIRFPKLEEQEKIANFLSSIDKKIDLVSTQIENTKDFKKGLLQQMFV